ncbi:hypothetical protein CSW50_12170 [Thermus scotoductus]|uniref:Uncharacterized protein n=1 Tax=Thermus scotoductus TaxID=37636 RepID=A0A430UL66_THESC|nr:hypothetical protein CSW50_12170 [Thermus scotoductus]RTI04501.1 hypothetical protein CSW30_13235 [Thermus scotoductus]
MARKCQVCVHPRRSEIDELLVQSVPIREIVSRFDGISGKALYRHRAHIAQLIQRHEEELADDLVARIRELNRIARETLEEARQARRYASVAALIGSALKSLELEAKLIGKLQDGKVQVGVGVQVQMGSMVAVPVAALEALQRAVLDAPVEVRERIAMALAEVVRESHGRR